MMKHLTHPRSVTEGYLAALFFLLPLYVHNAYFDITEAKVGAFVLLTGLYVLAIPLCEWKCEEEPPFPTGTGAFLLYVLLSLAASLLFVGRAAFMSPENRYQGVLVLGLYGLMFLFVSRWGEFGKIPRTAAVLSFLFVSLLTLLQGLNLDVLGFWEGIRAADRSRYLSTIGNVNFLGAYLAILLPLTAGLCCECGSRVQKGILAAVFSLGCCALLCGSDCGLLGAGAGILLLPLLYGKNRDRLRSLLLLLGFGAMTAFLYALLSGGAFFSALGSLLTRPSAALSGGLLCMTLWLLLGRREGETRLSGGVVTLSVFGLLALGLLLCNLCPALLPERYRDYVVFSESWGSDRGKIWLHCWELFRSQGLLRQLIGGGSGVLARYDALHRLFSDAVVDCAHNEYLHTLLTAGVLGLGAYLFALIGGLRRGRSRSALCAAVFACAVQGVVNIAQCATTPLLLALLALLWRERE